MFESKHVRIMAEHGCDGVWELGGGAGDLEALPISEALQDRLGTWNAEYGKLLDPILTPHMKTEPFDFVAFTIKGLAVAKAVKSELPDWTVEYFDEVQEAWRTIDLDAQVIHAPPSQPGIRWKILGKFPHSYKTDRELAAWEAAHGPLPLDPHPPKISEKACRTQRTQCRPDEPISEPFATPFQTSLSAEGHE